MAKEAKVFWWGGESAPAGNNMVATFKHTTAFLKGNCDTFVNYSGATLIMSVPNPPSRCQKKKKKSTLRSAAQIFFFRPR
jgi:hypothetical protein